MEYRGRSTEGVQREQYRGSTEGVQREKYRGKYKGKKSTTADTTETVQIGDRSW